MNAPRKTARKLARARTMDAVIRVSRVNGRKGESFMSPDEQRETIDAWAAANHVTIARYHDELDVSGGSADRAGLQAAVDRALSGETDGIVVAKVDRFARTLLGGLTAVGQLRAAGSTFVAVKDGIDGETASTPTGRMLLGILFLFAQWQLESLTEQWENVRVRHIAAGVHAGEPFGYRKGDDKRLYPDPDEAPWVVVVFEARAAGESWTSIANKLNDAGVSPRRGQRFTHARISQIVENRVYLGEARSGSLVNADAHAAIVTPALWEAANGQRRTAIRRDTAPFSLAGLVRCASCGVRMSGFSDPKTLADGTVMSYRYYRCRRSHSFGVCPAPARVRADVIEPMVERVFRDLYLADRRLTQTPIESDDLAAAQAAVDAARADVNMFASLVIDDPVTFQAGIDARQERLRAAQAGLEAAQQARHGFALPPELDDEWDSLPVETRRGYLSDGIALVAVAPGRGPVLDRAAVWAVNDPDAPTGLPGLGGDVAAITPLTVPAGTWEAAS